jgi:hypothetical protein
MPLQLAVTVVVERGTLGSSRNGQQRHEHVEAEKKVQLRACRHCVSGGTLRYMHMSGWPEATLLSYCVCDVAGQCHQLAKAVKGGRMRYHVLAHRTSPGPPATALRGALTLI